MQQLDQKLSAAYAAQREKARNSTDRWSYERALDYVAEFKDHAINKVPGRMGNFHSRDCVLDIGCGGGAAVRATADIITEGYLIGIDASPGMVQFAEAHCTDHPAWERMRFAVGTAEDLPLPDDAVTGAWATDSGRHWPDERKGMPEAKRVIAPWGRILVIEDLGGQSDSSRRKALTKLMDATGFAVIRSELIRADDVRLIAVTAINTKAG